jgi:hypothetical protein
MEAKIEYFAFEITNENKVQLANEFDSKDVMPATNLCPEAFVPGHIAVVRLISMDDPFVDSLGTRQYSVWIATRELFESKFVVDGTHEIYDHRLQIHPK